jgi:hypothetical protein
VLAAPSLASDEKPRSLGMSVTAITIATTDGICGATTIGWVIANGVEEITLHMRDEGDG